MANNPESPNYHPLVRHVAKALRSRCRVKEGDTILIACSGGADSIALLRALALLAERRKWQLRLIIGHVQHHLRGEAAEQDAVFVAQLADSLGLGFERRDINPADHKGNLEANARRLRYRALADIAAKRSARHIATAHHADDQLETLIMRLLRGTTERGLRGIAWRKRLRTPEDAPRVDVIRPMLRAHHAQALDFLKQLGQTWQEDATNQDITRTRARLRHDIIPLLKQLQADAADKAQSMADYFGTLHQLVQDQVDAAAPEDNKLNTMPRQNAQAMSPIVLTQVLRRDLIKAGVPRDRLPRHALKPVVDAVRDQDGSIRTFPFADGIRIEVTAKTLRVVLANTPSIV